jgi:PTH1 family peptidyl-tRNA hydrolase
MNVSGPAVKLLLAKYDLEPQDLVLVFDELDLPWTGLRIRKSGSAGTHNGVKSVVNSLGQSDFARVRLGIQPAHPVRNAADYVLAPFPRGQYEALDELLDWSSTAVESILAEGVEKAMTRFNRRARGLINEEA